MNSKIKATLRKFLSIALAALILAGCAGAAFADGSDASGTVNGVDWVYTSADKTLVLSAAAHSAKMLPTSGFSAAHGSPSM